MNLWQEIEFIKFFTKLLQLCGRSGEQTKELKKTEKKKCKDGEWKRKQGETVFPFSIKGKGAVGRGVVGGSCKKGLDRRK